MTAASSPIPARGPAAPPAAPPGAGARIATIYEHMFTLYRRTWRGSIFNSFVSPVLFLLAMGIGLGGYVDSAGTAATGGVPYLAWLGPGLLASTVMQTASFEATFPIMAGFVWTKRFHAMHASPIQPREIAVAHLLWSATRVTIVGSIFVVVMLAFGAVRSPLVVFAIPAATLTGFAFTAPISAYSATQRTMNSFNYIFRFGITPLFLFSGTFFPVDRLPTFLQPVAWLTPAYHGVELCRSLALGTIGDDLLGGLVHLGVLIVVGGLGTLACLRTFDRRLEV